MSKLSPKYIVKQIQQKRLNKSHERMVKGYLSEKKVSYTQENDILKFTTQLPILPSPSHFQLRINSTDFATFLQFLRGDHFQSILNIATEHQIEINSVVDAGANIGLASLFFKLHLPNCEIIAIEPDSGNFTQLHNHIKANSLLNIKSEKAALWFETDQLQLKNSIGSKNNWAFQVEKNGIGESINGYSLQYFMEKYQWNNIDLLKIDIEESEKHLFKDQTTAYEFLQFTKVISIEVHEKDIALKQVIDILKFHHFDVSQSGELLLGINKKFSSKHK